MEAVAPPCGAGVGLFRLRNKDTTFDDKGKRGVPEGREAVDEGFDKSSCGERGKIVLATALKGSDMARRITVNASKKTPAVVPSERGFKRQAL